MCPTNVVKDIMGNVVAVADQLRVSEYDVCLVLDHESDELHSTLLELWFVDC